MPADLQTGIGGLSPATNRPASTPATLQNGLTGTAVKPSPLSRTPSQPASSAPLVLTPTPTPSADLMNVEEDDWDPLEAFSEPPPFGGAYQDTVEEDAPELEPDFFVNTLSTTSPRKVSSAPKTSSGLKLGATKAKPDAFLDSFGKALMIIEL
jgi:hypothetical protein